MADHNDPNSVNGIFPDVDVRAADVHDIPDVTNDVPFLTTFPYLAEPW